MTLRLDTMARRSTSTVTSCSCRRPGRHRGAPRLRRPGRRHRRRAGPTRRSTASSGPAPWAEDGVHLLHSMGDTFAVMRTLEEKQPASAVIVGAGYIGLEMAEALTARGLAVTQIEQLAEVLPTVDPELGALVHAELAEHGVEVLTGTAVRRIARSTNGLDRSLWSTGAAGTARSSVRPTWCWSSWACDPTPSWPRRPVPSSGSRLPSRSIGRCGRTCLTCSRPGTASSPTTACSDRPICRWGPPPTSRAGWQARTRSVGTGSSPEASAPRSSRSSTP